MPDMILLYIGVALLLTAAFLLGFYFGDKSNSDQLPKMGGFPRGG